MATYYINPESGNNANDGLSPAMAWSTRAYAASRIAANDRVILMALTDTEDSITNITVRSAWIGANSLGIIDGTKCTLNGTVAKFGNSTQSVPVIFENINFNSSATPLIIEMANNNAIFKIINCTKTNSTPYFINHTGGNYGYNAWMEKCVINNCTTAVFSGAANRTSPTLLSNCKFENNLRLFPYGAGVGEMWIIGSIFKNTALPGSLYFNYKLLNNILNNSPVGLGDRSSADSNNSYFVNNVFMNCESSTGAMYWEENNSMVPIIFDYNLFYNNVLNFNAPDGTVGVHNLININPEYLDPTNDNFSFNFSSPLTHAGLFGDDIGATVHAESSSGGSGGISRSRQLMG